MLPRGRWSGMLELLVRARGRAGELRELRRRLRSQRTAPASREERELACRLGELRERVLGALSHVESCTRCARGHPEPFGHWPGGHCCGGRTEALFTDDELRALGLAGTTPAHLTAPSGDGAGCLFRRDAGCSLQPRDRPNLCVRYLCRDLERELGARPDGREIRALGAELGRAFARFQRIQSEARERREPWE